MLTVWEALREAKLVTQTEEYPVTAEKMAAEIKKLTGREQ
jgi:hypothetical protein